MPLDPKTPVLVGVAAVQQRCEDARQASEPFVLMADALAAAAENAGSKRLLTEANSIRVPRGFWQYGDPGRLIADRLGTGPLHTVLAEIGVLQQTLLSAACRAIAEGREDIALVTGGEAKYRELRARIAEIEVAETAQADATPVVRLEPREPLFHDLELARGMMMPVRAFAMIDTALRHHEGQSLDEHQDVLARLVAEMSAIAAGNPHAWRREAVAFEEIRRPSARNRMMAFPYARLHNSDWNVDQAAGLIFCSVAKARTLGIEQSRWIFPLGGAEANHVVNLSQREALHRSPGARLGGERVLASAGCTLDDVAHLDLYSCFPAAVRVFERELGLADSRPRTVTGGMAFAGGPLNNYVLQACVRMAEVLRDDWGALGLVTSVSGFLNKQGFALWSSAPPTRMPRFEDVTAEVHAMTESLEIVPEYEGAAGIASYTVPYRGEHAVEAIAICDLPDQRRTIAITRDPDLARAMTTQEFCGRSVSIGADGVFTA